MGPFDDLRGHVSIVTGGNSGIGLGIARGLVRCGAQVAVLGTSPVKNEAAIDELAGLGDGSADRVAAWTCDVGDEQAVDATFAAVVQRFGRLDSLFASAGLPSAGTPFLETSLAEWHRVLRVNLDGAFLTFRAAARHLVSQGEGGSLVGIASLAAIHGQLHGQQYSASKGGLVAMVRACAVELARHDIRANVILPGSFATPMSEPYLTSPRYTGRVIPRIPMRRSGEVDELAALAVYLAGPHSRYHSGDTLVVDGGYSVF
jgi:NAD(P)-dependent dehydrogenase (short-subunit alcohol dehydrogenase family)